MAKIAINLKEGSIVKENDKKDIIVGIDLGTTNSLIAYIDDGMPIAIPNSSGKTALVPSVIYFDKNDQPVVGSSAKPHLFDQPERTIYSVKRLLGKSYADIKELRHHVGYQIIDEDEDSLVKIKVGKRFYNPIELSSLILAALKKRAETYLDTAITKAVITVPAYFNDSQRQATRDAGKLAGLDVLRIVNEPTAASLAYGIGLDRNISKKIAVYDLGGGTFDITILEITDGIFDVLSTNGDTFLGGDDIDRSIQQYWIENHQLDSDILEKDKKLGQQLRNAAEECKKHLSTHSSYKTTLDNLSLELNVEQLKMLMAPLVETTIQKCKEALSDAQLTAKDIDDIVLVGGSTKIPYIREEVGGFFQKNADHKVNPDEAVALGAAIQADILAGNRKDLLLLDITPLSLGIETVGGLMDVLIPRNTKVPTSLGRNYTTSVDGQKNLKIAVYQGERDLVKDNRKLGEFILRDIPPMAAGLPKIEIQFLLDADGILRVKAKELRSGVETQIEIKSTYGISEEEMGRMLLESLQNAKQDMEVRSLLEAKNESKAVVLATEKFLSQNSAMLSEDELNQTRTLLKTLKDSLEGSDKDTIQEALDQLNNYTRPFAQIVMESAIKDAMKGKKI